MYSNFRVLTWNQYLSVVRICKFSKSSGKVLVDIPEGTHFTGPPDPVSNLREKKFHVSPNETEWQKHYRLKHQEVHSWNQMYWTDHNLQFQELKKEFITKRLAELKAMGEKKENLDADEMAVFYKKFLNNNHKKHITYNWTWYKKNVGLLWLEAKANLSNYFPKFKNCEENASIKEKT